jgi:hypothetical protein
MVEQRQMSSYNMKQLKVHFFNKIVSVFFIQQSSFYFHFPLWISISVDDTRVGGHRAGGATFDLALAELGL